MCGRFAFINNLEKLKEQFEIEDPTFDLTFNYNVAPSQLIVGVVREQGKNKLDRFRWGLIPIWAKEEKIGNQLINARSETIHEKPSFRQAFKKRRCIIVASGYFEWKKIGKDKVPMYVTLKDRSALGFAGLFEKWTNPEGQEIQSCTIITTDANKSLEPIHHRMPAILKPADYEDWLDNSEYDQNTLSEMLQPYDDDSLEAWEVSKFVNSPANNTEKTIKPSKPTNLF